MAGHHPGPRVPTVEVECRACGRELDGTAIADGGFRVRRHHTHPGGPWCPGVNLTNHQPVDVPADDVP